MHADCAPWRDNRSMLMNGRMKRLPGLAHLRPWLAFAAAIAVAASLPSGARAAETLDKAVQELADGLSAHAGTATNSQRLKVAVTAFPHTDQTTSELSIYLV